MDVATLSQLNEFLVLDAVRAHGETTRTAIAGSLGLSPASVSRIVKRLLDAGLVIEAPEPSAAPGRNPGVIRLNERAGGVIAIDLGGTKCHAAVADLTGEVLAEDFRATHERSPLATLVAAIEAMRAVAAAERLPVRAVVIGIPAVIDPETGLAIDGPNVGWSGFDLQSELAAHVSEPLLIENDVNLAALGQAWCGEGRAVDSFVTVSIGTGIGAAVVVGGELLRGRRNAAGELGSIVTRREQLHAPAGTSAGFESVASGPALAARARELLDGDEHGASALDRATVTAADVFAAAARGDLLARAVIGELLDDLAIALISVTGVVDPERIVLEGSVGRSLEPYLPDLRDLLARRLDPVPDVRVSHLGPNATVAGAIASALALIRQNGAPAALPTTLDVTRNAIG